MVMRIGKTGNKAKTIRAPKGRKASAASSSKTDEKQASRKIRIRKRVTAAQIRKANELMMKAWDMISQRNSSVVDV